MSIGASATAQTDGRPAFDVVLDNRSPLAAVELAAARLHVRFMFDEAGIRVAFVAEGDESARAAGHDRIRLVVLVQPMAGCLKAGDVTTLGFALPPANRVYVHYDRVYALARSRGVQAGWFLGVVMAHELVHVLLPRSGHAGTGVMARALSPDPAVAPAFTREEAQALRERLRSETLLARR
jgi:hypothetical protein